MLTLAYELRRRGGGPASPPCAAAAARAKRSCCALLDVLVIGAGPYGLAAAKAARDKGLSTRIVGRHMAFWREHMPAGMFLRSGPDWHLDPAYELTLERYLEQRGETPDPLPIGLFLDYTDWFTAEAELRSRTRVDRCAPGSWRRSRRARRSTPATWSPPRHRPLHPPARMGGGGRGPHGDLVDLDASAARAC